MTDAGRTRVRIARAARRLVCGCRVPAGSVIVSRSRGPWHCAAHSTAPIHVAGLPPRRGAATVAAVLAAEAARGP